MFFRYWLGACAAVVLGAVITQAQVVVTSNFTSMGRSVQRSQITEFQGGLYFNVAVDGTEQRELWRYDSGGVALVDDRFVGETETSIDEFIEFQGALYFSADDGKHGNELYRYDGNEVSLAADMTAGPTGSYPVGLFVHDDALYYSAKTGESFNSLWRFDGQQATKLAEFDDPRASVVTGATYQGDLYFGADDGISGMELWKYDGQDVVQVADIAPGPFDAFPRNFQVLGDKLVFKANSETYGQELWQFDGQSASVLKDINPGLKSADPQSLQVRDGKLYFSAVSYGTRHVYESDGETTRSIAVGGGPLDLNGQLMVFDGRREGKVEIQDIYALDEDSGELSFYRSLVPSAGPFAQLNDELFFSCECDVRELFMAAPAGDSNGDGIVAFDDFLTLSEHFGRRGSWAEGDFDQDGTVGFPDFLMQAENYGRVAARQVAASVPEPNGLAAALLAAMMLAHGARRRR